MKFCNLLVFALCFCACATNSVIKTNTDTTEKTIPVFMTGTKQRAAFKTGFKTDNKTYNFLLLANKKEDYINFKVIGDFAAVLVSANLRGNSFEYETLSPLFADKKTRQAFEEILIALFTPNALGKHKYYFKKGENLPYKLKQSGQVNKTFLFENYEDSIPQNIIIKAKFNLIEITLDLLAYN